MSKKLTVALLIIALEIARGFGFELPPESEAIILKVSVSYLLGQSVVDVALAIKGAKTA